MFLNGSTGKKRVKKQNTQEYKKVNVKKNLFS